MNETLSVIDEHITDMNSPRSSYINGNKRDTMGSVYSNQPFNRLSYIPGHETDEDEHSHTEEEVMAWSPARVAEYLEDNGVERAHCEVFKEQEISGEVLLAMDQSSIFIKEFDLGPVGRRLKTWHKIKALQDEVRHSAIPGIARSHTSGYSAATVPGAGATDDDASMVSDVSRNRSSTMGTILPRGLEPGVRQSMDGRSNTMQSNASYTIGQAQLATPKITRSSSNIISPLQSMTSMSRPENTYRPSAQVVRQMNHARRHSSIDSTSSAGTGFRVGHKKQASIDQKWQPGQPATQPQTNGKPAVKHAHSMSGDATVTVAPKRESSLVTPASPGELDRGYFSSTEVDNRHSFGAKKGNVLTKKNSIAVVSPVQSRTNSVLFGHRRQSALTVGSRGTDEPVSSLMQPTSGQIWKAMGAAQSRIGASPTRSATSPVLQSKAMADVASPVSPVVTKLEYKDAPSLNAVASSPNLAPGSETSSKNETPSPTSGGRSFFGTQKSKSMGFRAISEAVTKTERSTIVKEGEQPLSSPTRTGSTTPSTETRSFDLQKSMDGQSRTSTGSVGKLMPPPATTTRRTRPKTKKATSAYTRGLEKKGPAEMMARCDYSGWMKKKSGSLMSTWKPRLFILRGRRLSYYYREDDVEEKGLIDISFHRVLPATNETLTGLHAAVTGAVGSPTSPTSSSTPTNAQKDLKENPPEPGAKDEGLFIFKLVPPKSGLSKGVNFTKPTVHYFAVNSRQEGRLWMAALMKATIDRDDDGVVTTTYNQKTISLAKAKARRERPPALKEEEVAELDGSDPGSGLGLGLGIGGLASGEKSDSAVSGAEKESIGPKDDEASSSLAPTTTGESEELNEGEKGAVALHAASRA